MSLLTDLRELREQVETVRNGHDKARMKQMERTHETQISYLEGRIDSCDWIYDRLSALIAKHAGDGDQC
jgi:hypothetical protein